MSANVKNTMREVMKLGWQFIKKNGYTKSEALKVAWANIKLKAQMQKKVVMFWYRKATTGEIRQAFGSLAESIVPPILGNGRKPNDNIQTYWDTEKGGWRCFKKVNLLKIA